MAKDFYWLLHEKTRNNYVYTIKQIIMHAKQTLLFSSDAPWVKKDACDSLLDVTMVHTMAPSRANWSWYT